MAYATLVNQTRRGSQKLRQLLGRLANWGRKRAVASASVVASSDCLQSDQLGPVFGSRLSQQTESPDYLGVPLLLTEMVKALRLRGLGLQGIYRVPGQPSKVRDIIELAYSNLSQLCARLDSDEEAFHGREISSAIKRYLGLLPTSLPNVDAFASVMLTEDLGRCLRTPAGLARTLGRLQVGLASSFCRSGCKQTDSRERKWRLATLNFVMYHLREIVALQASNRMSPRALASCITPSLFGSTENSETNSQEYFTQLHFLTSLYTISFVRLNPYPYFMLVLLLSSRCWNS